MGAMTESLWLMNQQRDADTSVAEQDLFLVQQGQCPLQFQPRHDDGVAAAGVIAADLVTDAAVEGGFITRSTSAGSQAGEWR